MTIAVSKTLHLVRSVLLCACVALFAGPERSNAADQPSKPVRIVMLSPVGTAADLAAPMFADRLTQRSRRPVIVDNQPVLAAGMVDPAWTKTVAEAKAKAFTDRKAFIDRHVLSVKFNKSIHFHEWALAPMAHTRFCLAYSDECKVRKTVFRGGAIKLTAERGAELININAEVNRAIAPERNTEGLAGERWLIAPKSGECHDYAVTKRHQLLARGWPARVLLLAEVVTNWGKHHLVLVVRTDAGDLVADNLNAEIRTWTKTSYLWVQIQSRDNPLFWATVASTPVYAQLYRDGE
jgi:predicted transglutaminase-like cysteine proteinase